MLGMTQSITSMIPILKPLTFPLLEAVQKAKKSGYAPVDKSLRLATVKWLNIYHDLLEWRAISLLSISAPLASPTIGIFKIKGKEGRHVGLAITGKTPCQITWSDCLRRKVFCNTTIVFAFPQVFLLTVGLLCAVWLSSQQIHDSHFTCYIDSPILAMILRKRRDKQCKRTTTVIEAAAKWGNQG